MNESTLTSQLLANFRTHACVVLKHADMGTIGVPDISISVGRRTCWIEVKFVRRGDDLIRLLRRSKSNSQLLLMNRLETHSAGALYVVYFDFKIMPSGLTWQIWRPSELLPFVKGDSEISYSPVAMGKGRGYAEIWKEIGLITQ